MNYKLKSTVGKHISDVCKEAKKTAFWKECIVEFDFNGIKCLVDKNTNIDHLIRDYMEAHIMDWKTIGPDCVKKYSQKVKAEIKKRTELREKRHEQERKEYEQKRKAEKERFESITKGIELELSDPDGWAESRKVNNDGYGGAALDYAECWAKLMQVEISQGKKVSQCYDSTQKGLGFLGITGFQFGCAVSVLCQTWAHGEELKRVHNRKYGVKDETEGAVNPAVLSVKK